MENPLCALSIGLLGLAMEASEIAGDHKDVNVQLVPRVIQKLQKLTTQFFTLESSPPSKRTRFSPNSMDAENRKG